jgi:hypothetical protein
MERLGVRTLREAVLMAAAAKVRPVLPGRCERRGNLLDRALNRTARRKVR